MPNAYPLDWPKDKPRNKRRSRSQFKVNFAKARDDLIAELDKMRAVRITISSNVPLRQDGLPRASFREPDDPGVAVYFTVKRKSYVLSCDRWDKVKDNLRAIGQHIAALRGIERWGVTTVEEMFSPFLLPEKLGWWSVLGIDENASKDEIKKAYRRLSLEFHPDSGGDRAAWERIREAYEEAIN